MNKKLIAAILVLLVAGLLAVKYLRPSQTGEPIGFIHTTLPAHADRRDLIDDAAAEVAAELKQQYTLGYRPTNRRRDGAFRQIKVELLDKSLRVRTKRVYYIQQAG